MTDGMADIEIKKVKIKRVGKRYVVNCDKEEFYDMVSNYYCIDLRLPAKWSELTQVCDYYLEDKYEDSLIKQEQEANKEVNRQNAIYGCE